MSFPLYCFGTGIAGLHRTPHQPLSDRPSDPLAARAHQQRHQRGVSQVCGCHVPDTLGSTSAREGGKIDLPLSTNLSFHSAANRKESEVVLTGVVTDVLAKTGLQPADIDILIINCSIFTPTPSLCAMVSNKFKAHLAQLTSVGL